MEEHEAGILEIERELGKSVVEFQRLEASIDHQIFSCLTSEYRHIRILITKLGFRAKVNAMRALVLEIHKDSDEIEEGINVIDEIESISKECFRCEERRNQLVHSTYFEDESPDIYFRAKDRALSKKGYSYTVEVLKKGDLAALIMDIVETTKRIDEFCLSTCIRYGRTHGLPMLSGIVNHESIVKFIRNENSKGAIEDNGQ